MVKNNELGFENTQSELLGRALTNIISETKRGTFKIIEGQNSEP